MDGIPCMSTEAVDYLAKKTTPVNSAPQESFFARRQDYSEFRSQNSEFRSREPGAGEFPEFSRSAR
jgi:hypothetical protein